MKTLYIVPGTGLDAKELDRRQRILNTMAGEGNKVDVKAIREGPLSIETAVDEALCVPDTLRLARESESDYDAFIIGCYGDPGIEALRVTVRVPVIGPGEASMLCAAPLGHKFSVVTVLPSVFPLIEAIADKFGLLKRLASVRATNLHVLDVVKDPEGSKKVLHKVSREAVEEDGADTLVLGCMSEAFVGADRELSKELGVPVVNPISVSVKMAESLHAAGLSHSPRAFGEKELLQAS